MSNHTYSGTSRNTDPFTHGLGHLYEGMKNENMLHNLFKSEDMKGRVIYNTENNDIIEKLAGYIKEYGMVRMSSLCSISKLRPQHIKYLFTYRYTIYESDDGRWLGMLDERGDPYPIKTEPVILPKYKFSKTPKNKIAAEVDGEIIKFTSRLQAANYFNVDPKTIESAIGGNKIQTPKLKGVKIYYIERPE